MHSSRSQCMQLGDKLQYSASLTLKEDNPGYTLGRQLVRVQNSTRHGDRNQLPSSARLACSQLCRRSVA